MKINITVHPNSKNPRVIKKDAKSIDIYVREPATEDKANISVIKMLATIYNVPKTFIKIITGGKSKHKVIELSERA